MTGAVTSGRAPRVAVLWTRVTGYVDAALRALVDEGAELLVFRREPRAEAPFDVGALTQGMAVHAWSGEPDGAAVRRRVDDFDPDVVVVCSWDVGAYRRVARALRGRTLRILAMDNQWWGTPKQWGGVAAARWVIRPTYDAALVPGERQAAFAQRLGFPVGRLVWGMNTCDHPRFAAVADQRGDALPPEAFLFAGRLVPDKAIDVLATAYAAYRRRVDDPWPLLIAGTGPDERLLADVAGVERLGFVQPDDLPAVLGRAGCLVLPSRFEPWGVVVHEAAAAGLPVVCTRACGASTRLVLDGYNGAVVGTGDVAGLTRALVRVHRLDGEERRAMGAASRSLAGQYTPRRWARNLLARTGELRAELDLTPEPWAPAPPPGADLPGTGRPDAHRPADADPLEVGPR
jgi:glycosyltransferase involved in cell wall biosynthesis